MFSPDATAPSGASTRNPRRRHRTTSEDSLTAKQTSKRRKRSLLAPETFELPSSSKANGGLLHGQKDASPEFRRDNSVETTSLTVRSRGSKRGEKRSRRDDGALQAKNDHYVVSKDPNVPKALSDILGLEAWQAEFSQSLGYAVALTHTKAIVWPYSPKSDAMDTSKSFVIKLPYPSTPRNTRDPLPRGVLVHDSGAGELALLVVMPNGKVVYWESVANAVTADVVRQKNQGLHGTVSGMISGEIITEIADAEPDGFVLTSSVGRIIHLSVRDLQGRPNVNTSFLRSANSASSGLLGSFKSVFSSTGWKRDIAATRSGPLRGKNNRQCIFVNVQGLFQVWDLARHGAKNLEYELEAKTQIHNAILAVDPKMNNSYLDFRILDFTFFPASKSRDQDSHNLLVLSALTDGKSMHYFLVDLTLRDGSVDVRVVHPVTCWERPPIEDSKWPALKSRVLLPEPGHTAFIMSDTYFIMVSLGIIEQSSDSQIQLESHSLSEPFQDILFLNRDTYDHLVACTVEPPERGSDRATCLLLANAFGFARATAFPAGENESAVDRRAAACRSRIEQAVFFGDSSSNFLDFRLGLDSVRWEDQEIETAALEINDSIIDNKSQYIPSVFPSMDHQLKLRATALHDLIKYAGAYKLSRETRWQLLWSAEKMMCARAIWQTYNDHLASKSIGSKILLPEMLDMLSEKFKHENQPDLGETDIVRHYLTHDVRRIENVIPWAQHSIEELYTEGLRKPSQQAYLVSQANDIQIAGLQAAFTFREANAELYGVGKDMVEDGIFQGSYETVSHEFWTSGVLTVAKAKQLADLAREVALNNAQSPGEGEIGIDEDLLRKLAIDCPTLVHQSCQVYEERIRFLVSRPDDESKAAGTELRAIYHTVRPELILKLTDIELFDDAYRLAEKYNDMKALANVYTRVENICEEAITRAGLDEEEHIILEERIEDNARRLARYFKIYSAKWADAIYGRKLEDEEFTMLLNEQAEYRPFLTQYLRSKPELGRIGWMNEVSLGNYKQASDDLVSINRAETTLWGKKIELSMAKLSILAAAEASQVHDAELNKRVRKTDRRLNIVDVQERLYAYTRPLLRNAIDKEAAVDLAMDSFGSLVEKKAYLNSILRKSFEKLVQKEALDAEELIDTVTLITSSHQINDETGFADQRFFLALDLLRIAGFEGERKELHLRQIWRRCLLQDDWATFNRTETKDEEAVATEIESTLLFQTLRLGYKAGLLERMPPLPPSDIFDAGTSIPALRLSARYAESPDVLLKALAEDLEAEDMTLAEAVDKGRLEMWWPGIMEAAKAAVRREADEDGEERALREEARRTFEDALREDSNVQGGMDWQGRVS